MRHLVISSYGSFLGIRKGLLVVKEGDKNYKTYPLSRLRTLSIAKKGVTFSSDLVEALSLRGVKLFFLNFKGTVQAALISGTRHGVVSVRMEQYQFCQGDTLSLAKKVIEAKIKNQRAVLNYYSKYHKHPALLEASETLKRDAACASAAKDNESLLGYEGSSAKTYFKALKKTSLFSSTFQGREGRGSQEINNSMLNLGYAILSSYVLNCVENAGLEPYLGFLHKIRPGKMSLVLDIIEEYRAWVVDRAVIKLRLQSEGQNSLTPELKRTLIKEIQGTCGKHYLYRKKKIRLEHIMQRQIYRLSGHFCSDKKYRPYLFKW